MLLSPSPSLSLPSRSLERLPSQASTQSRIGGLLLALAAGLLASGCGPSGQVDMVQPLFEDGELVAPVAVLRFDDTLYRVFGDCLEALTDRAELLLDASTYERRSTASIRTPGALVSDLTYTL